MKARITRGRNFRGCISYVSDRKSIGAAGKKQAEYICGTVPHSSVKEMVREMMLPLSVKSVEKPVYHISLSMPKGEERRSNEEWEAYVDAFLNKCYGYFYPDDLGRTKAWFVVGADISPLNEIGFDLYARFPNAVRKLDGLLEAFRQIPLLGYTSSVGFYTWCTFLSMFFILLSKKKGLLWLFVPAILVILVCVASPVNAYFRYELPVVFSVPYFFAVTVYAMKTGEKEADAGQC